MVGDNGILWVAASPWVAIECPGWWVPAGPRGARGSAGWLVALGARGGGTCPWGQAQPGWQGWLRQRVLGRRWAQEWGQALAQGTNCCPSGHSVG